MMIRELVTQPQEIAWLPWAVQYFFFIGLAATASLIVVILRLWKKGKLKGLELLIMGFGTTAGIVGPIALLADLHQPGRFINFYLHLTPWSWMWIGAVCLPLFVLFILVQFLLLLRENTTKEGTFKWLRALHWGKLNPSKLLPFTSIGLLFFTFMILLYTGKEASVLKAQALWYTPWLPWVFFFSALQAVPMSVKAWNALSSRWSKRQDYTAILSRIQLIGLIGFAGSILGWSLSNDDSGAAFRDLINQGSTWITLGAILSAYWIILTLYSLINFNRRRIHCRWLDLVMAIFALALTWTLRWTILMQTQTLPKYNIMSNPYHFDWGFEGFLGIMGTFGLWITLVIVVWSLLQDRWLSYKQVQQCA